MAQRKFLAIAGLAMTALLLSACTAASSPPPSSQTTLNGGEVVGDDITVLQLSDDEVDPAWSGIPYLQLDRKTVMIEAGGSGSKDCASNFVGVKKDGHQIILKHQVGNGDDGLICTMDYRPSYFLVHTESAFEEGDTLIIEDNGAASSSFPLNDGIS